MSSATVSDEILKKLEYHKKWLENQIRDSDQGFMQEVQAKYESLSKRDHDSNHLSISDPVYKEKKIVMINELTNEEEEETEQIINEIQRGLNMIEEVGSTNGSSECESQNKADHEKKAYLYQYKMESDGDKNPKSRWETLYGMAKKMQDQKTKVKEYQEQEEFARLQEECTFQPKLTSNMNFYNVQNSLSIHERNKLWKEQKEAKLAEERERERDRDLVDCTFKPKISQPKGVLDDKSAYKFKGVEKFVRRQAIARQQKEEKEQILCNPLSRFPAPNESVKRTTYSKSPIGRPKTPNSASDFSTFKKPCEKRNENSDRNLKKNSYSKRNIENEYPEDARHQTSRSQIKSKNDELSIHDKNFGDVQRQLRNQLLNFDIVYDNDDN